MKFPASGDRVMPFFSMRPSCTGVTEIEEAPTSITRDADLPEAKLYHLVIEHLKSSENTHEAKTPFRASQNAGQPQFSIAISIPFSRSLFQPVSVISRGFSCNGFSRSSTPSIFTSSLFGSFKPLDARGPGFAFVSREVIAYSHRFAAVSQSSTVPSLDITLLIDILGRDVCIELSPNSCL